MNAVDQQLVLNRLDELRQYLERSQPSETDNGAPGGEILQALQLLHHALASRATDVHIDPSGDEFQVRFRIDGQLEPFARLDRDRGRAIVNQLETLAGIDAVHHFEPWESRLALPAPFSVYDVRISTTPVAGGDAISLRLLERSRLERPLDQLGLGAADRQLIHRLLEAGEGLLLVTGPTGVGKTTTVYSMLHLMDNGRRNIVTIEDPVELKIPSYRQVNVDPRHGLTMASGLRTLLRMDPDIVMVGEIRDVETAEMTMRAASAGKMVFSTLHTRDAASTITALRDLHVDPRSLASNLVGLISQRLVRRLCTHCRRPLSLADEQRSAFEAHGVEPPREIFEPGGCEICRQTGYLDRAGVFEVLPTSAELVADVQGNLSEEDVRQHLRAAGVRSLMQDAMQKVADGVTSLEEIQAMHSGTAVSTVHHALRRRS